MALEAEGSPVPLSWSWRNCDCLEGTLIDDKCGDDNQGKVTHEYKWTLYGSTCRALYKCQGGNACSCWEAGGSSDVGRWGASEPRGWCDELVGYNDPNPDCANVQCDYDPTLYDGIGGCACKYTCGHFTHGACTDDGQYSFTRALCAEWGSDARLELDKDACWGPYDWTVLKEEQEQREKDLKEMLSERADEVEAALRQAAQGALKEITNGDWGEVGAPAGAEALGVTAEEKADCLTLMYECNMTGMSDMWGSKKGENRCRSCYERCIGTGSWPSRIQTTSGFMNCDYRNPYK